MTHRQTTLLMVAALLCALPFLLASGDYRFTFDNPSVGHRRAPFILEYFSVSDCSSCRDFEDSDIAWLEPLIDAGQLRIIYRDLPSFLGSETERRLFCLQEYSDYLQYRRAAKTNPTFDWHALPTLNGRAMARYEQCLTTSAASEVHRHNRAEFDRRGFEATPAFTLVFAANRHSSSTHWTGRPTTPSFHHKMDLLRASVSSDPTH